MVKVVFDVTVVGSVVVVVEGGLVAAAVGLAVVGLVEDGISTAVVVSGSSTAVVVVVVTNVVVSVLKTNLGSMILGVDFLLAFTMIPPETGTAPTELRVEDEEEVNEVVVVVVVVVVELGLTWVVDIVVVVVVIDIVVVGVVDVEDFCEARRVSVLFLGRRGGVMRMEGLRVPSS